jgi:hypothetical protein
MSTESIIPTVHLIGKFGPAARELDELFAIWTAADRRAEEEDYGDPRFNARADEAWQEYEAAKVASEWAQIAIIRFVAGEDQHYAVIGSGQEFPISRQDAFRIRAEVAA